MRSPTVPQPGDNRLLAAYRFGVVFRKSFLKWNEPRSLCLSTVLFGNYRLSNRFMVRPTQNSRCLDRVTTCWQISFSFLTPQLISLFFSHFLALVSEPLPVWCFSSQIWAVRGRSCWRRLIQKSCPSVAVWASCLRWGPLWSDLNWSH